MTSLREAAKAVLDRWDSPAWEWHKQGPTAELMAALRAALAQEHDAELSAALEVRAYVASAVAAEREQCAMVCKTLPCRGSEYDAATMDCAAAIRDGA